MPPAGRRGSYSVVLPPLGESVGALDPELPVMVPDPDAELELEFGVCVADAVLEVGEDAWLPAFRY
jgi:hypothetical protein